MKRMLSSRRDHYLARVSIFLITVALVAGTVGCGPSIEIRTWYDLDAVRDNLGGTYLLMNDLDSTTPGYEELASPTANQGKGWQPIGTTDNEFTGTFDGQGYAIEDLFINRPEEDYVGLFGETDGGVIRDMGVVNVTVIGGDAVGGLVGDNAGAVSNSYSTGSVTSLSGGGGLVGGNAGTVSNSYSTGSVTCLLCVGGLLGGGGLVGENAGTVSDSFWDTETSGQTASDGGAGKTTAEMQDVHTFSDAGWNITAVAPGETNPAYIWNIVNGQTYPFLSWES